MGNPKEYIDCLSYNTNGDWSGYNIIVFKSDLNSYINKSHHTNLNYLVMTEELYDKLKNLIPAPIGIYIENKLVKEAKRISKTLNNEILYENMMFSLFEEYDKNINRIIQ